MRGPGITAARYALLTDGSTVLIRPATPADTDAVRDMTAAMSPDNQYLRFFSLSPHNADGEARRVCRESGPDHAALLAWLGDRLVGVASYEAGPKSDVAEVAFAVPDDMHGRGTATLTWCRSRGRAGCTRSSPRRSPRTGPCSGCSPAPGCPCTGR
jgi:hypothetical protein